MKKTIKKFLIRIGLRHPAKGIKISGERKVEILLSYRSPEITTLVETGTQFGTMIEACKNHFKEIYSVELDDNLYTTAVQRFQGEKNIHLYHGDSAQEMPNILSHISSPALFWLDAHGGGQINFGNSPIEAELNAIFNHTTKGHIILIDDARHFTHKDIRSIKRIAYTNNYRCVIDEGLFRITPI